MQLRVNRYGYIRFALVPERVSTKSFDGLIIGKSKSNYVEAHRAHLEPSGGQSDDSELLATS